MILPTDNGVYSLYSPDGRNAWGKSVGVITEVGK